MRLIAVFALLFAALLAPRPAAAEVDRAAFLDLARKGWVYELRSSMWRRPEGSPEIVINGIGLAGAALCIIGERPHPQTLEVLDAFADLMRDVFGKTVPRRHAGRDLSACGTGRSIYLRLYSGATPHRALNTDLQQLDATYGIGFTPDHAQFVASPAQGQTFFGRRGLATHVMVKQPREQKPTPLERRFFASILIEELYQSFTFGMDVLQFNRRAPFVSKLQEIPMNLRHLSWESPRFMEALLRSNPGGLCRFDVFMLHALATAQVKRTNSDAFLRHIDRSFDRLVDMADGTMERFSASGIVDGGCEAHAAVTSD